jgi:hypothetical protein
MQLSALLILLYSCGSSENKNDNYKSPTKDSRNIISNELLIPEGWTTEQIIFPIDFASQINYKGSENLRFAKGWEDISSEEHWCYAFLWHLDGKPEINETILQQNLTDYYSGLVKKNIISRTIPSFKVMPTVAKIKTITTAMNDATTFSGTIHMLDYIAQSPIILNIVIHVKNCSEKDKTNIFFEVSPQALNHVIWTTLDKLNASICK